MGHVTDDSTKRLVVGSDNGTVVVLYTTGSSYFRGVISAAVLVFAVHGGTPRWVAVSVSERRSVLEPDRGGQERVQGGSRRCFWARVRRAYTIVLLLRIVS